MKIRLDFVTNSSSSSFIAYGFYDTEIAEKLREANGGAKILFHDTDLGHLLIDGGLLVSVRLLNDVDSVNGYHIYEKLVEDKDLRTYTQIQNDNKRALSCENALSAYSGFATPEFFDGEMKRKIEKAYFNDEIKCFVYVDQTDGFQECPHSYEFDELIMGDSSSGAADENITRVVISDEYKKKATELFECNGEYFRVNYLPKAMLNKMEKHIPSVIKNWVYTFPLEYATDFYSLVKKGEEYESAISSSKALPKTQAFKAYVDFIKVCLLYTKRELMEEVLKNAPRKKNGTLAVNRVQHLAFMGTAYGFQFYELCAVNETDNVVLLEIRFTECSHRHLPAFREAIPCDKVLEKWSQLAKEFDGIVIKPKRKIDPIRAAELAAEREQKAKEKKEREALIKAQQPGKREQKAALCEKIISIIEQKYHTTGENVSKEEIVVEIENAGLSLREFDGYLARTFNKKTNEYFEDLGILKTAKTEFYGVIEQLQKRYENKPKLTDVTKLFEVNADLNTSSIAYNAKRFTNMSAREFLLQEGILVEDEVKSIEVATDGVLFKPGEEPENIRKRLDILFPKLDEAYPDKVIVGLNKDHREWSKTVTDLYRKLGYKSGADFLTAYGYKMHYDKGGRPKADHSATIEELKRRYPNGADFKTTAELVADNPDIAKQLNTLQKDANQVLGMSFGKYLKHIGLIK